LRGGLAKFRISLPWKGEHILGVFRAQGTCLVMVVAILYNDIMTYKPSKLGQTDLVWFVIRVYS